MLVAPQAVAEEVDRGNERARVVSLWRLGGPAVREAAAAALVGSAADISAFLDGGVAGPAKADERTRVAEIRDTGGLVVKEAAQRALDAGTAEAVTAFLESGWVTPHSVDLRVRVNQLMASGGPELRAAAQTALDNGTDEALSTFLTDGWRAPHTLDLRLRVNQVVAVAGPRTRELGQRALDAGTIEAFQQFLDVDWAIGQARDQETATVAELAGVAKVASGIAAQETQSAKDAADRAVTEAALAKAAAQKAADATESARGNAAEAAKAAAEAADAAERGAVAAQDAVGAANAASSAAWIAANAASRAATAASMAGQAASRAYSAAAAAVDDASRASDARTAAQFARSVADGAEEAAAAASAAGDAARNADAAAQAASSAGANSAAAAEAAAEAADHATAAGADGATARNAAAHARAMADRATRAANAAHAFAVVAANAADRARDAARRAAQDALTAAAAADDAAEHAGNAANAAEQAARHAEAATAAATTALEAATQAREIFGAARTADSERLAVQADKVRVSAMRAKEGVKKVEAAQAWDAEQAAARDAETNRLIAEATAAGADPALVVSHGRKIALRLADSRGPWSKAAADAALIASDAEVTAYVRTGIETAAARDDRITLAAVAERGSQALRDAANAALAGSDADVRRFLREQDYPGRDTEDRVKVNNILNTAREQGRTATASAAQRALDAGTGAAYRDFLNRIRFNTAVVDDRVKVNQIIAAPDSGPATKAMAQAALDGPPAVVHDYLEVGRYTALRQDADSATHIAEVSGYLAQAASAAATAVQNSFEARAAAAVARGAAEEASGYAQQARDFAGEAAGHAQSARESAASAERSAQQAADSARTAASAAASAQSSARAASRSAVYAQASADQAAGFAQDAYHSAKRAYAAKIDAGEDARAAQVAAEAAFEAAIGKIDDAIALQRLRQGEYCQNRYSGDADKRAECIRMITATAEERTERAFVNGALCDNLYGHVRESPLYQNCTAEVLSPDFASKVQLDAANVLLDVLGVIVRTALVAETLLIATVAVGACIASVVCNGIMLSLAPEGMAFFHAWTAAAYAGGTSAAIGLRLAGVMEWLTTRTHLVRQSTAGKVISLAELAEAERRVWLGIDPATGNRFDVNEYNIAVWLENNLGVHLTRVPVVHHGKTTPPTPDWIDTNGKTYDALTIAGSYFDTAWPNFQNAKIPSHLAKADYVPIYAINLSPQQLAVMEQYVKTLGPRVFIIIP
ncbi:MULTISPECIES: hypothetical protein [unclassified Saccharothrix]|uniref:hypothetical protein n=1 Tax=unclassified Saccharothrix TaxID=2593673 RepID=UPI00307ED4EB